MGEQTDWALRPTGSVILGGNSFPPGVEVTWEDQLAAFGGSDLALTAFKDDFEGNTLKPQWMTDLSTGAAIALTGLLAGGQASISTDTDDDDHATLAIGTMYSVANGNMIVKWRVTNLTAITLRAVEIGISDSVSETNGLAFSNHGGTPVAVATDAAVVAIDSDVPLANWKALSVKAGGTVQATDTGVPPVAGTFQNFETHIDKSGNVKFYIDGVLVATHLLAVSTNVLYTNWLTLKSLSGAAKTIRVDFASVFAAR